MTYDEAADFAEHTAQLESMQAALAASGLAVDWAAAVVCDVGGGGGLRAALLSARVRRSYCADLIDQQARYAGEFVRLLSEKLERHGHVLAIDRFEFNVTDATALLYRDAMFDFAYSFNAFEHIGQPAKALCEIARVLRAGGLAYLSFDPIWTADTGSHYQHRVPEPWAHLVLGDEGFIERMRSSGASDWEVQEFKTAMNRVRLSEYRRLFDVEAAECGLVVLNSWSWTGVADERNAKHPNFEAASRIYSPEELMTRGMSLVLRRTDC